MTSHLTNIKSNLDSIIDTNLIDWDDKIATGNFSSGTDKSLFWSGTFDGESFYQVSKQWSGGPYVEPPHGYTNNPFIAEAATEAGSYLDKTDGDKRALIEGQITGKIWDHYISGDITESERDQLLSEYVNDRGKVNTEIDNRWRSASLKYAQAAEGKVTILLGDITLDELKGTNGNPPKVLYDTEFDALVNNSKVTHINGIPRTELLNMANNGQKDDAIRAIHNASLDTLNTYKAHHEELVKKGEKSGPFRLQHMGAQLNKTDPDPKFILEKAKAQFYETGNYRFKSNALLDKDFVKPSDMLLDKFNFSFGKLLSVAKDVGKFFGFDLFLAASNLWLKWKTDGWEGVKSFFTLENLQSQGINLLVGAATIAGASFLFGPLGVAGVVALGAVANYEEIRKLIKTAQTAYPDWEFLKTIDNAFDTFESKMASYLPDINFNMPNAYFAEQDAEVTAEDETDIIVGLDNAALKAEGGRDYLLHFGHGLMDGGEGNDILLGLFPDYLPGDNGTAEWPDLPSAENGDQRLEMDGGSGNDILISIGGTAPILYGGTGEDTLFAWSLGAQMFGDGADDNSGSYKDTFWWSPGSVIEDAEAHDRLSLFGVFNLTGGLGVGEDATWAPQTLFPFIRYSIEEGDLVVRGFGQDPQIVRNYTGGPGVPRDKETLGIFLASIDFKVRRLFDKNPDGYGEPISTLLRGFSKSAGWMDPLDPLVLDLDSDGVELTGLDSSSLYFDLDGDLFAENTGWVRSDDGFLAMDVNGDGLINDISELFGAPGVSGFTELAALDSNADGVVDALDADFANLLVWRDLNQNAISETEELFTLADLDIVSLGVTPTALNRQTSTDHLLTAWGTFTRGDGSTGNSYDVVLDVDLFDTKSLGDSGVADWAATLPDLKGYGVLTDLAVAASNDFTVAQALEAAATGFTTPDLEALTAEVQPLLEAWSQANPQSRELAPVLVYTDAGGASRVDYGVYAEDATGGYWQLASGAAVLASDGVTVIDRPTLQDILNQTVYPGEEWRLQQMWSPDRDTALQHRDDVPYLAFERADGTVGVADYGIEVTDASGSYWTRASGAPVLDTNGAVISRPTLNDVLAQAAAEGQEWRTEAIAGPENSPLVGEVAAFYFGSKVHDYSVFVQDGGSGYWTSAQTLRDAITDGTVVPAGMRAATLDNFVALFESANSGALTRTDRLQVGSVAFAAQSGGLDVADLDLLLVAQDADGILTYEQNVATVNGLLGELVKRIEGWSKGAAVRVAAQSGLSSYFTDIAYDVTSDSFRAGTDRELIPFFEAVFTAAPATSAGALAWLGDWREIFEVVYQDFKRNSSGLASFSFIFSNIVAAYESTGLAAGILDAADVLGVPKDKITYDNTDGATVTGTYSNDIFYVSTGNQVFEGGQGTDAYVIGANFGQDIIRDTEPPLIGGNPDLLRFADTRSTDVSVTRNGLDLIITVNATGDTLTVEGQFEGRMPLAFGLGGNAAEDKGVAEIIFADGVVWDKTDIAWQVAPSLKTDLDDLIMGTPAVDVLDGGLGNDILEGGRDSDLYLFNPGYGQDSILDRNDNILLVHTDVVLFGEGISKDNLVLNRNGASNDVTITVLDEATGLPTGDSLTLEGQFSTINTWVFGLHRLNEVELLIFNDGSSLDADGIMDRVLKDAKTDGADAIYGFYRADRLDGGAGDDFLSGGDAGDTYVFGRGYGLDVIRDAQTNILTPSFDRVEFAPDVSPTDIELVRVGDSDEITLRITGTLDELTIQNQYTPIATGAFGTYYLDQVEEFVFTDGSGAVWNEDYVKRRILKEAGTPGDDVIYGFASNDVLDGGQGNDTLYGGAYSDTYIYARGYGDDTIGGDDLVNILLPNQDRVVFTDLAFADVEVSRNGTALIFTIIETGETLTLAQQYTWKLGQWYAVEQFQFTDQIIDYRDLNPEDIPIVGTSGNDTLTGTNFGETLDGGAGNDQLFGKTGSDRYIFNVGYGSDVIDDRNYEGIASTDKVIFGPNITTSNVQWAQDGDDLLVTIAGNSTDVLRVVDEFSWPTLGVEEFHFTDSSGATIAVWTKRDIKELLLIAYANEGDDIINGFMDQPNVLDGREGNDELWGGQYGDIYLFGVGYDSDTIYEATSSADGLDDTVVFSQVIDPEDLRLTREGDDIVIDLRSGDQLRIAEGLGARRVEVFDFADGTIWDFDDIKQALLQGTDGADRLIGYDGSADLLDGGLGSDDLEGGTGDDVFRFDIGYGQDSVLDTGGTDAVDFGDLIAPEILKFAADGTNLVIEIDGFEDDLVIYDGLGATASRIEEYRFGDGRVWTFDDVRGRMLDDLSTDGDDLIEGFDDRDDALAGGLGDDTLSGGGGADLYTFNSGDGLDVIDDQGASAGDRLVITGHLPDDVIVRAVTPGSADVRLSFAGSDDEITIIGGLDEASDGAIEEILFDDGTVWTAVDLRARLAEVTTTAGDDVIYGQAGDEVLTAGSGDDIIYGGGGADTYVYERGGGVDLIADGGSSAGDRLEINGYGPNDVRVVSYREAGGGLKLVFQGTDDRILLRNADIAGSADEIEEIAFGDGTTWTAADLRANQEIWAENPGAPVASPTTGSAGDDVLSGDDVRAREFLLGLDGDDVLSTGAGDDRMAGGPGNDVYVYEAGDGNDTIENRTAGGSADTDTLRFGSGIAPADVTVGRSGADLTFTVAGAVAEPGSVTVLDFLGAGLIDRVEFDDGTVWLTRDLLDNFAQGTAAGETILGAGGSDVLIGYEGDDYIEGKGGSDTYYFGLGDGADTWFERGGGSAGDRVFFGSGISPDDLIVTRAVALNSGAYTDGSWNHLDIAITGASDTIRITNQFVGADTFEEFAFQDGTLLSHLDMSDLYFTQARTAASDIIIGTLWNDTFSGGAGDDFLRGWDGADDLTGGAGNDDIQGGKGNDTYRFNLGDGQDTWFEYGYSSTDKAVFGPGITSGDLVVTKSTTLNSGTYSLNEWWDVTISITGTADSVYIFQQHKASDTIESFVFDDGTVLSDRDIDALYYQQAATSANDTIIGSQSGDTMTGGAGDDYLRGWDGNDDLTGGTGNDDLQGGKGDDTYRFNVGDGQDVWFDYGYSSTADKVVFGAGITPSDLLLTRNGLHLDIAFTGNADQIQIYQQYKASDRIETFHFADGTVLKAEDIDNLAHAQLQTAGADTITGFDGNDVMAGGAGDDILAGNNGNDSLTGGLGNDDLQGNAGNDTYYFNLGDGQDTWWDGGNTDPDDKVVLGPGLRPEMVDVQRSGSWAAIMTFEGTTDQIFLSGAFYNAHKYDSYVFDNGLIWTDVDIGNLADGILVTGTAFADTMIAADTGQVLEALEGDDTLTGGLGADELRGFSGADTLSGGAGNDILKGGEGDDLYLFDIGDGADTISDLSSNSTMDVLRFGSSVLSTDISYSTSGNDLALTLASSPTDSVLIKDYFGQGKVETIEFSDGSPAVGFSEVIQVLFPGRGGNESYYGGSGADIIYGGSGNDYLEGRAGTDTYLFELGHGQDRILDNGGSEKDRIVFGDGINLSDLSFQRPGDWNDLIITNINTADSILIDQFYDGGNHRIDEFYFADGTVLDDVAIEAIVVSQASTSGNDVIVGSWFSDVMEGGAGDDSLYGRHGSDSLDGGIGNDYLEGRDGADTYYFDVGDGQDRILDNGGNGAERDRIVFGDGILLADLNVERPSDRNDLLISISGTADSIYLNQFYDGNNHRIEEFWFADGTIIDHVEIEAIVVQQAKTSGNDVIHGSWFADVIEGGAGNDSLYGRNGADILNGGAGDDYLDGGDGQDTYLFGFGDGNDTILDGESANWQTDKIVFGPGVTPDNLRVEHMSADWDDLRITLVDSGGTPTGDTLIINEQEWHQEYRVEEFHFADGTVWTYWNDMAPLAMQQASTDGDDVIWGSHHSDIAIGGAGNDTIRSRGLNDTLDGGPGDDYLDGGNGQDTYLFGYGGGNDIIFDNGNDGGVLATSSNNWETDYLVFGPGITPGDLHVELLDSDVDDIKITLIATGDSITIDEQLNEQEYRIEYFDFADGTRLNWLDMFQQAMNDAGTDGDDFARGRFYNDTIDGGPGHDRLYGYDGADTLYGGTGDDELYGGNDNDTLSGGAGEDYLTGEDGSDTYRFTRGDGYDVIDDNGSADTDRLEIFGYARADVTARAIEPGGPDLLLTFADTNDRVVIINALNGSSADGIEEIVFEDGSVWTVDSLMADTTIAGATAGDDVILGTNFSDRMQGLAGADLLDGGAGADTYIYNRGDGDDRIADAAILGETDRLEIRNYTPAEVAVRRTPPNGLGLVLTLADEGDRLIIADTLEDDGGGVEEIAFDDGTVWSMADLRTRILNEAPTDGNDRIWGFSGDETLEGGLGNDTLSGGDGSDDYVFNIGDGIDLIEDNGSGDTDRLLIHGYTPDDVSLGRWYKADDGAVLTFAGSDDRITILNTLNSSIEDEIEQIVFDDGTVWDMAQVNVLLANNAPVTGTDSLFTAPRNTDTVIPADILLSNDYDPDGDPVTIVAVKNAEHGSVALDASGDVVFTPDSAYLGMTEFTYTVSDGRNALTDGTVYVRVVRNPQAQDDTGFTTTEDIPLTLSAAQLFSNDVDGDLLIMSSVSNAVNGSVTLLSNGDVIFTPATNFSGTASFDYAANTPDGGGTSATVTLDVTAANDTPVAGNDSGFATGQNAVLMIQSSDLLANDSDVDGDTLSITSVFGASNGAVTLDAAGTISFTPDLDYFGPAGFSYTISDGQGGTAQADVSLTFLVNSAPPVAGDDSGYVTDEDTAILVTGSELLLNDTDADGDTLTISRAFGGPNGSAELLPNQSINYTPDHNFNGSTYFTYEITDGKGKYDIGRVDLSVTALNDAPTVNNESFGMQEDSVLTLTPGQLLANDWDVDGDPISLSTVSSAVNGTVTIDVNGDVVFTPDAEFWGLASFNYVVSDGVGGVAGGQAFVNVAPVSDAPPVAVNDSGFVTPEDTPILIPAADILANDTDIDNDPLTIVALDTVFIGNANGSAALTADGDVIFTPHADYNGSARFEYTVSDGANGTDKATVSLLVTPVNDAPVAVDDTAQTSLDAPLIVRISDLLANDTDVDEESLSFVSAQDPSVGALSIYDDRWVVVMMPEGYTGPVSFTYTIADPSGITATGTVLGDVGTELVSPLVGTPEEDLIGGTPQAEEIHGLESDDILFGYGGDDILRGGDGGDRLDGGDGFDLADFSDSNIGIRMDIDARVGQGGYAERDILVSIEGVIGTGFDDDLFGTGGDNLLLGGAGNDELTGRAGADTLQGEAGDDVLVGGAGADVLDGGAGVDVADYSSAASGVTVSLMTGSGTGGDAEGDTLTAIENLTGTLYADSLAGDDFANRLDGGRDDDTLAGGGGDDILTGGEGADALDGGAGSDTADYSGSTAAVTISLESGTATGGHATGDSFIGIENVTGSFHADSLTGDAAANRLTGGGGDDVLDGRGGNDILDGGAGLDEAAYGGVYADYEITRLAVGVQIRDLNLMDGDDGTDLLVDVETVQFADLAISPDYNDVPVGDPQSATLDEDSTGLALTLTASDGDLDPLTFAIADGPAFGTLTGFDPATGAVTYVPNPDFWGVDSFTFTAFDGLVSSDPATVSLTVNPINDAPVAEAMSVTTDEDTNLAFTLAGSDVDFADTLSFALTSTPVNGVVTGFDSATGNITYVPNADFNGSDSFTYTVSDGILTDAGSVSVTVNAVNDAPVANDQSSSTNEDTALALTLTGSDIDGDTLTFAIAAGPLNGTLSGLDPATGAVTYTPNADFNGADSFTFTVSDGLATATGTVDLSVLAVNDAPVANPVSAATDEDNAVLVTLSASDVEGDTLTFALDTAPANGTISAFDPAAGTLTYTPDPDFNGTDSFTFTVSDAALTATGTATVTVAAVNDAPVADGLSLSLWQEIAEPLVLAGSDIDGDTLTFAVDTGPTHGVLTGLDPATGAVTYTPDTGYFGTDSFTYTVSDGALTATGTADLYVYPGTGLLIEGDAADNILDGAAAAETLAGYDGNDTLNGYDGDDVLVGGAGQDILDGGLGFDTVSYAGAERGVRLYLGNDAPTFPPGILGEVYQESVSGTITPLTSLDDALGVISRTAPGGTFDSRKLNYGPGNATNLASFLFGDAGSYVYSGIDGSANFDNMAVRLSGYIELEAGIHSFTVSSDEGFRLTIGDVVLSEFTGLRTEQETTASAAFEAGLYKFELVYFDNTGDEDLSISSSITGGLVMEDENFFRTVEHFDPDADQMTDANGRTYYVKSGQEARGDAFTSVEAVIGSRFDDVIFGDGADNKLTGLDGDDELTGGAGADIFAYRDVNGHDTITDFAVSEDFLTLEGSVTALGYSESDVNGDSVTDTVVDLSNGDTITLLSVSGVTSLNDLFSDTMAPIILDLDGDGAELVAPEDGVLFDLTGRGDLVRTGWVGRDDALLVLDRNGDGRIKGESEISFLEDAPGAPSDLAALAAFDSNMDGLFDVNDDEFANFLVWQDINQDGISQKWELRSLIDAGIASIDLTLTPTGEEALGAESNVIVNVSSYTRADGSSSEVADVVFAYQDVASAQRPAGEWWQTLVERIAETVAARGEPQLQKAIERLDEWLLSGKPEGAARHRLPFVHELLQALSERAGETDGGAEPPAPGAELPHLPWGDFPAGERSFDRFRDWLDERRAMKAVENAEGPMEREETPAPAWASGQAGPQGWGNDVPNVDPVTEDSPGNPIGFGGRFDNGPGKDGPPDTLDKSAPGLSGGLTSLGQSLPDGWTEAPGGGEAELFGNFAQSLADHLSSSREVSASVPAPAQSVESQDDILRLIQGMVHFDRPGAFEERLRGPQEMVDPRYTLAVHSV